MRGSRALVPCTVPPARVRAYGEEDAPALRHGRCAAENECGGAGQDQRPAEVAPDAPAFRADESALALGRATRGPDALRYGGAGDDLRAVRRSRFLPAAGDWLSGRAPRSHRGGHWFDPSIAHPAQRPVPTQGSAFCDLGAAAKCSSRAGCQLPSHWPSLRSASRVAAEGTSV